MANIWLDTTVLSNHKIKKLIRIAGHEGFTCLLRLWIFSAEHRSTGKLTGLDEEDITDVCEWSDKTCGFAEILIKCNLLEIKHGIYYIHDFIENNPYIAKAKARSEAAKKAAAARWEEPSEGNANAMQEQCTGMSGVLPKKRKEKKRKETTTKDIVEKKNNLDGGGDRISIPKFTTPKDEIPYQEILDYLNMRMHKKNGRGFKNTDYNKKYIRARWKEGWSLDEIKSVIDKKVSEWMGSPDHEKFLRPETLFGTKFESYHQQPVPEKIKKKRTDNKQRFIDNLPIFMVLNGSVASKEKIIEQLKADKQGTIEQLKWWRGLTPEDRDRMLKTDPVLLKKEVNKIVKGVG